MSWLVASIASLGSLLAVAGEMSILVASVAAGIGIATGATTITALVASALWATLRALLGLTYGASFLALAGEMSRLSALVANV